MELSLMFEGFLLKFSRKTKGIFKKFRKIHFMHGASKIFLVTLALLWFHCGTTLRGGYDS